MSGPKTSVALGVGGKQTVRKQTLDGVAGLMRSVFDVMSNRGLKLVNEILQHMSFVKTPSNEIKTQCANVKITTDQAGCFSLSKDFFLNNITNS